MSDAPRSANLPDTCSQPAGKLRPVVDPAKCEAKADCVAVCPVAGNPGANALRVDAVMPAHRHGMNYAPSLREVGPGHYRADGLMFHMPGLWEFRFELRGAHSSRPERLSHQLTLD
jgi:ferredoxin